MTQMLTERYRGRIVGTLSCFDRIVITGTLPGVCYAQGMTSFLYSRGIRIFDYTKFVAPLKKTIYSLHDLREILAACNRRYLEFLSALEDTAGGERDLARLSQPKEDGERTFKGLNFFNRTEQALLRALQRPEFNLRGLRRADVKPFVPELSVASLSRQLHRLRALGLIKRAARTYRYYLTRLGRAAIAAACSLTQFHIIPALAYAK